VFLSVVSRLGRCRCAGSLILFVLSMMACGCGSSSPANSSAPSGGSPAKGADQILKPEQLWKYEGTGTEKRKVSISRRERAKLLREATTKAD
jgi:hypothetical protein